MTARRGAGLEAWLDTYHAHLRAAGLAELIHVPTPAAITGRSGRHVTARLGTACCVDYLGVLRGGRAVAIEAKASGQPRRWSLTQLADHQRRYLAAVHRLGGLALLVLEQSGPPTRRYCVPWPEVEYLCTLGASVLWTRLADYQAPHGWLQWCEEHPRLVGELAGVRAGRVEAGLAALREAEAHADARMALLLSRAGR